jgi:lipoprotein-anchoring transpeptidase ErfK/SrfK
VSDWKRRDFLKLAGATLTTALFRPPPEEVHSQSIGLGRITEYQLWAYNDPRPGAQREVALRRDEVVAIYDSFSGEGLLRHNPVWNLTKYGWVYSSWVQPVERQWNPVVHEVPDTGFWAQVTVPYIAMRAAPKDDAYLMYRLYYSSVHLVIACLIDAQGDAWYQLKDDQYSSAKEYVRAEGLRRITPDEMTPLSLDVKDKRIEVNLTDQMVYAFENDKEVFSARCATGTTFSIEGGYADFRTPIGDHSVVRKRPSRHMLGFQGRPDAYDLPGVPFCTYLTTSGAAIHGAYWHNDFGHPRSHGCVNVPADVAKWFYRWSMPVAPYEEVALEVKEGGTPIIVKA